MAFRFRVFEDPTIQTATAVDLARVATTTQTALEARDFVSMDPDAVMHAASIALRSGWKISNMWSVP